MKIAGLINANLKYEIKILAGELVKKQNPTNFFTFRN